MVSSGTGILIAQYNGASRTKRALMGVASIILAIVTGMLLSIIAVLGAEYFIPLYQLEAQVEQYAQEYLFISGTHLQCNDRCGSSPRFYVAMVIRTSMVINLIAGVINVFGNYCALYQPLTARLRRARCYRNSD